MPLPQMAGDASSLLDNPGMSGPSPTQGPSDGVDPKDQARGAVELVSKLRSSTKETLESIATQFPAASKPAKELAQMIDQGIQRLIREIVKTTNTPEPAAPAVVR